MCICHFYAIFYLLNALIKAHMMVTCGISVSLFPDHSGTTPLSLQNFLELNKLCICLGKSFFFSPGLVENSGPFQTIQTGDCECI